MLPTSFLTRRRVMSLGLASAAAPVVATMFGVSAEAQDFGPASGKLGVIGGRDEKVLFPARDCRAAAKLKSAWFSPSTPATRTNWKLRTG